MSLALRVNAMGATAIAFVVFGVGFTAYRAIATYPASAEVESVQWSCDYEPGTTGGSASSAGRPQTEVKADCSRDWKFQQIRRDPRQLRFGHLMGSAYVTVRYWNEQDSTWHEAVLTIDSALKEFYTVEPGQKLAIRVNRWHPDQAGL